MKLKTIRTRILVFIIALILFLYALLGFAVWFIMPKTFYKAQIEDLEEQVDQWIQEAKSLSEEGLIESFEKAKEVLGGQVYLIEPSGGMMRRGNPQNTLQNQPLGSYEKEIYKNKYDIEVFSFSIKIESGILLYEVALTSLTQAVGYMFKFTFVMICISLILAVFMALTLSKHISMPIGNLDALAKQMREKKASPKIVTNTNDEILRLNQSVNLLYEEWLKNVSQLEREIEHVKRLEDAKKLFLASAAHELKTPVAILKGTCEMIEDGLYKDEEELNAYIKNMSEESEHMTRLLEELLDFTRLEQHTDAYAFERTDLSSLLVSLINKYEPLIQKRSMTLETEVVSDIGLKGDAFRLEQMIKNLLNNAMDYGKDLIEIKLYQKGHEVFLTLYNEGSPISERDLPHITEEFYRGASGKKGHGLGLSTAKAIVKAHGGSLLIENEGRGVMVTVCFTV